MPCAQERGEGCAWEGLQWSRGELWVNRRGWHSQLRTLLRIHHRGNRDTEIRNRAPEIWTLSAFALSIAFIRLEALKAKSCLCTRVEVGKQLRGKRTCWADIIEHRIRPDLGIDWFHESRHFGGCDGENCCWCWLLEVWFLMGFRIGVYPRLFRAFCLHQNLNL